MYEENMTNEVFEETEVTEINEEPETSGNGIFGAVALVTGLVGAAGLLYYKTRNWREARQVQKLRKKGYHIEEPVDEDEVTDDEE